MTAINPELITRSQILAKMPSVIKKLPRVIKGLRYVTDRRADVYTGLGLTFSRAVKAHSAAIAIKYKDIQLTYHQLDEWSNQMANYLLSQGLKKGDVFAIAMENRPELLCACLAAAKTGTIAALINTSQSGKVLLHSVNLVNPKLLIIGHEIAETFQEINDQLDVPADQYAWWDDIDTYHQKLDAHNVPKGMYSIGPRLHTQSTLCPESSKQIYLKDGLFYIFTSGTTGLPKAVILNHGRWMKAYGLFGHAFNLTEKDTLYVTLPLYHATAMVVCWSCAMVGGSAFALQRQFSASNFWHDIKKFDATSFGYVGELCRYLIDTPPSDHEKGHRVTKVIGNGLRPSIWKPFKERFGINEVLEIYGSSEGNIGFFNLLNFDNTVGLCPVPYKIVAYDQEAGAPLRDQNGFMQPVGRGEAGLLLGKITDKTPFDGYTDPKKTQEKIFRDVFTKGDAYFNTGDIMRDIGFKHCQFVDRIGDTFRWRGENVSTTEVESIIADCRGISEAIVYGVEIQGTNGRAGMAAITLEDAAEFDAAFRSSFINDLAKHLPRYAIPIFIRVLKSIETTGTFKYQKTNLKKVAFDPSKTDDPLWVRLPKADHLTPIDPAEYKKIQSNYYRF